jgi:hypothetical protein
MWVPTSEACYTSVVLREACVQAGPRYASVQMVCLKKTKRLKVEVVFECQVDEDVCKE